MTPEAAALVLVGYCNERRPGGGPIINRWQMPLVRAALRRNSWHSESGARAAMDLLTPLHSQADTLRAKRILAAAAWLAAAALVDAQGGDSEAAWSKLRLALREAEQPQSLQQRLVEEHTPEYLLDYAADLDRRGLASEADSYNELAGLARAVADWAPGLPCQ